MPDPDGRFISEQLGLAFGGDAEGFLRAYAPGGEILLTHEEAERARREAESARQAAERRAAAAERRASDEAMRRAELEQRLAEMAAELEQLRGRGSAD
jgi:hypothetical protein